MTEPQQRPQFKAAPENLQAYTDIRGCLVEGCQQPTHSMVFCPPHFDLLPQRLKSAVWNEYTAGYEAGTHPTNGYRQALNAARDWLEENTEIPTG